MPILAVLILILDLIQLQQKLEVSEDNVKEKAAHVFANSL